MQTLLINPSSVSKETLSERTIFSEHEGSFGNYMDAKVAKQRLQDDDNTNSMKAAGALGPPIFKGVVVYTDGMLHIPEIEVRRLVLKYGGRKEGMLNVTGGKKGTCRM